MGACNGMLVVVVVVAMSQRGYRVSGIEYFFADWAEVAAPANGALQPCT